VLFRASHHSGPLEIELTRRNIPFVKYGGLKFLEAAHIKDVLAFLRWGENVRDRVSGFRVIQLLPGAGPATAARLLDRLAYNGGNHTRRSTPGPGTIMVLLRQRANWVERVALRTLPAQPAYKQ